jgi:Ca-activated chloride channel family protein
MKLQQPRHSRSLAVVLLLLACVAVLAQSVNTQTQNPPPPPAAPQPTVQPPAQTPVQTVRLNVSVTDEASNNLVTDLRQEDFRVEEDGVPQTITYFAREELPVSYALVMDNSGSLRSVLEYLIRAGEVVVSANQPGDETAIVRFVSGDNISLVQDFTASQSALIRGLESLYIEGGQTAILDAVYLTATRLGERRREESGRRRALILFTDGEDRMSFYKQSELQTLLRELDVQIFAVAIIANLSDTQGFTHKSAKEKALKLLNSLTQETGGRAFYPKNVKELQAAVNAITRELRTQYVVGYQSTNTARDGKFRKVQVKLNEAAGGGAAKRNLRVRAGYFAPDAKALEKPASKDKSPRLKSQ